MDPVNVGRETLRTMERRRIAQFLSGLDLFREVRAGEIDVLTQAARVARFHRRETIFQRGDACSGFYLVVYGRVKLSLISTNGVDKPLQFVEAGSCFGDITMLLDRPHYLTAQALEDSLLAFIPRRAILSLIENDSHFALRMLGSLSLRMRSVVDDIESFALQPPAARVVTYLLRLLPPDCVAPAKIDLTINKNMVAAQLNLTPETLSRYFRDLSDRGLVTVDGKTVIVHDIDRLETYMSGSSKPGA